MEELWILNPKEPFLESSRKEKGLLGWVSSYPASSSPSILRSLSLHRLPLQEGVAWWPGHSLFRGQCCRACCRASVTRSAFSRVALQPRRPIRSTFPKEGPRPPVISMEKWSIR